MKMKLSKFLSLTVLATFLCIVYVYQQTEIFRFGYLGQRRLNECQDLQDKNNTLKYGIEKSASLIRLGDKISTGMDFQMPDSYRLVKLDNNQQGTKGSIFSSKENLVSRVFGIKREAQAKTINP